MDKLYEIWNGLLWNKSGAGFSKSLVKAEAGHLRLLAHFAVLNHT